MRLSSCLLYTVKSRMVRHIAASADVICGAVRTTFEHPRFLPMTPTRFRPLAPHARALAAFERSST